MGQMYSFTIVLIASTHFAPFVGFASSSFAGAPPQCQTPLTVANV